RELRPLQKLQFLKVCDAKVCSWRSESIREGQTLARAEFRVPHPSALRVRVFRSAVSRGCTKTIRKAPDPDRPQTEVERDTESPREESGPADSYRCIRPRKNK